MEQPTIREQSRQSNESEAGLSNPLQFSSLMDSSDLPIKSTESPQSQPSNENQDINPFFPESYREMPGNLPGSGSIPDSANNSSRGDLPDLPDLPSQPDLTRETYLDDKEQPGEKLPIERLPIEQNIYILPDGIRIDLSTSGREIHSAFIPLDSSMFRSPLSQDFYSHRNRNNFPGNFPGAQACGPGNSDPWLRQGWQQGTRLGNWGPPHYDNRGCSGYDLPWGPGNNNWNNGWQNGGNNGWNNNWNNNWNNGWQNGGNNGWNNNWNNSWNNGWQNGGNNGWNNNWDNNWNNPYSNRNMLTWLLADLIAGNRGRSNNVRPGAQQMRNDDNSGNINPNSTRIPVEETRLDPSKIPDAQFFPNPNKGNNDNTNSDQNTGGDLPNIPPGNDKEQENQENRGEENRGEEKPESLLTHEEIDREIDEYVQHMNSKRSFSVGPRRLNGESLISHEQWLLNRERYREQMGKNR